jgi:hypothetical protein
VVVSFNQLADNASTMRHAVRKPGGGATLPSCLPFPLGYRGSPPCTSVRSATRAISVSNAARIAGGFANVLARAGVVHTATSQWPSPICSHDQRGLPPDSSATDTRGGRAEPRPHRPHPAPAGARHSAAILIDMLRRSSYVRQPRWAIPEYQNGQEVCLPQAKTSIRRGLSIGQKR